jgi:transcriptional regulator with XRE-family HTH domain
MKEQTGKDMFKALLGNRLRAAREAAGLTQDDVAQMINSTYQKVSSFETGRTRVTIETLVDLCKIYKINPNDILAVNNGNSVFSIPPEKGKLLIKINQLNEQGCAKLSGYADNIMDDEAYRTDKPKKRVNPA